MALAISGNQAKHRLTATYNQAMMIPKKMLKTKMKMTMKPLKTQMMKKKEVTTTSDLFTTNLERGQAVDTDIH